MVGKLTRCLLAAALSTLAPVAAVADVDATGSIHREPVDAASYPWSAIGKLFNEAGGSCTGAIISRDKILTAAHCVYNQRTRRFLPASALHFMIGYRSGQATVHARVASYETGAGYDPLRWIETMESDWVILTLTENLPEEIAPLKLSQAAAPSGTKVIIAGYPQDRAHKMTADRACELGHGLGRMMLHTCRGMPGYSGAPILVSGADDEIEIAGIHVAMSRNHGSPRMFAVPAQAIAFEPVREPAVARTDDASPVVMAGLVDSGWFE
jgi:protease YdgD